MRNAIEDVALALARYDQEKANRWRGLFPVNGQSEHSHWLYANGMLRIQLSRVKTEDTRSLREILVEGTDYDRWLQQVESEIVPFMIKNGLPG